MRTMIGAMTGALVVACGCQDDNHRLDGNEAAIHALEERMGKAESAAAQLGGEVAMLRAALVESQGLVSSFGERLASLAEKASEARVLHMVGPNGLDLGLAAAGSTWVYNPGAAGIFNVAAADAFYYESADCTGAPTLGTPQPVPGALLWSPDGELLRPDPDSYSGGPLWQSRRVAAECIVENTGLSGWRQWQVVGKVAPKVSREATHYELR